TAEVFFVNMREMTDLKWGTPQPITLRDSDLGLVRLRAFGQYTVQISEPKRFVDQIVGVQGIYTTSQIEDYLRSSIISRITDVLAEKMTSILDLPRLFDELALEARAQIQNDFAVMGILLKQFFIVSVSPTDDTSAAIDERASMGAIGDMDAYMKFKAARAIGDAAQQPGGTNEGLGLGAGIGMGAGLAGAIAGAMGNMTQSSSSPPTTGTTTNSAVMTLDEAALYLRVSTADVQEIIDSGELKAKKIGTQYRISREAIEAYLNN
ncbi:MAG: SPFH domain-containing protein, partial [Anaerolineales bacterium]|nr:SPFH domain-containing protein [Anaerolineales bacterium]